MAGLRALSSRKTFDFRRKAWHWRDRTRSLAVIRAESTDQAIRIANDTEYGLSAGVWSTDNQRALDVAGQLEAGTVWVNDWHMVNAAYPFGGYKQSGLGRELGPHALDEYTEEKFVHVDMSGRLDRRAYPLLLGTPPA